MSLGTIRPDDDFSLLEGPQVVKRLIAPLLGIGVMIFLALVVTFQASKAGAAEPRKGTPTFIVHPDGVVSLEFRHLGTHAVYCAIREGDGYALCLDWLGVDEETGNSLFQPREYDLDDEAKPTTATF